MLIGGQIRCTTKAYMNRLVKKSSKILVSMACASVRVVPLVIRELALAAFLPLNWLCAPGKARTFRASVPARAHRIPVRCARAPPRNIPKRLYTSSGCLYLKWHCVTRNMGEICLAQNVVCQRFEHRTSRLSVSVVWQVSVRDCCARLCLPPPAPPRVPRA